MCASLFLFSLVLSTANLFAVRKTQKTRALLRDPVMNRAPSSIGSSPNGDAIPFAELIGQRAAL